MHLDPHPVLSGSDKGGFYVAAATSDLETYRYYFLIRGLTTTGATGGPILRHLGDFPVWLFNNSDWGFGLLLANVFYGSSLTGWGAGDWQSEYSETYAEQVACIAPGFGDRTAPLVMQVLQEQADLCNADYFTREGLLNPMRREVAGTADLTVKPYHLPVGKNEIPVGTPVDLGDRFNLYANELVTEFAQDLLCEPITSGVGNGVEPIEIPHSVTFRDWAELAIHGGTVKQQTLRRRWSYFNFADTWVVDDATAGNQYSPRDGHLEYWKDAHAETLAHRAQPQIWLQATLHGHCCWLEQGMTIAYDYGRTTTQAGQVRDLKITGGDNGRLDNPTRLPVQVQVGSWHIDFTPP